MSFSSLLPDEPLDMWETLPPEVVPDVENMVTEDDEPVDNIFSEKQQRLLTEPLFSSWPGPGEGRPFLALANVGLFHDMHLPAIVPDAMLSLDVRAPADLKPKRNRSYFVWEYGKPPDVVVEVVSNQKGGELGDKMRVYERIRILYYAVFDPFAQLGKVPLRLYELQVGSYVERVDGWLEKVGLGLTLWEGVYEDMEDRWLRWCDREGAPIPTGGERAEKERLRADEEHRRAEEEHRRAERLAARLRELGVDPDDSSPSDES